MNVFIVLFMKAHARVPSFTFPSSLVGPNVDILTAAENQLQFCQTQFLI